MAISKVTSGGIADGTLSVEDIADDAVTAAKLANSINTDIATGVTGNTTANAALPKAGGTMTGALIGTSGTFSGNVTATGLGRFNTTSYTPVTNGEKVIIEGTSAWQQSLSFSMWGAGTYNSSYASGAIGVANSNSKIHISGGAQVVENPASGNWAKTLSATSASFNVLGGGQSSWYTDASLTANTAYTPTERVRIHNNGVTSFNNGVALGAGLANTAANTLDDYEEGTFEANLHSAAGSLSLGSNKCCYTKTGRTVTVNGRVDVSSVSSPSGELRILNLPFTSANLGESSGEAAVSLFIYNFTSGASGNWVGWIAQNSTFVYIRYGSGITPAGTAANLMKAGTEVRWAATYTAST